MSTKKSKPQEKKGDAGFPIRQATKLHALCRNIAHDVDSPDLDLWLDKAHGMVAKYLAAGQDVVFTEAFDLAEDDETIEEMRVIIETQAGHAHVPLSNGTAGVSTMFCVPVLIESEHGLSLEQVEIDGELLKQFTKSFKPAGLINADATVAMPRYLYHYSELDLPYSALARLPLNLAHLANQTIPPHKLAQTGKVAPEGCYGEGKLELYYLLGCYVDSVEKVEKSLGQDIDSDEEFDAYNELEIIWHQNMTPVARKMLEKIPHIRHVSILPPECFFTGFHTGREMLADVLIGIEVHDLVTKENVIESNTHAHIACYADKDEGYYDIGATMIDRKTGKMLGGVYRPIYPNESLEDATDSFIECLQRLGVEHISMEGELVNFEYTDDLKKRAYLMPNPVQVMSTDIKLVHQMPATLQ